MIVLVHIQLGFKLEIRGGSSIREGRDRGLSQMGSHIKWHIGLFGCFSKGLGFLEGKIKLGNVISLMLYVLLQTFPRCHREELSPLFTSLGNIPSIKSFLVSEMLFNDIRSIFNESMCVSTISCIE